MQPAMKPIATLSDDEFAYLAQEAARLPDAPPQLLQRAFDLWPGAAQVTLAETARAAWRVVAAVLSFDSRARPGLAHGMRSAGGEPRHLLFSARGRDIDLRISPARGSAAGRFDLTGQILGPDDCGLVELARRATDGGPGWAARRAELDDLGEFRLDGVDAGTVWLTIRTGTDEIVLPPIDVGDSAG